MAKVRESDVRQDWTHTKEYSLRVTGKNRLHSQETFIVGVVRQGANWIRNVMEREVHSGALIQGLLGSFGKNEQ